MNLQLESSQVENSDFMQLDDAEDGKQDQQNSDGDSDYEVSSEDSSEEESESEHETDESEDEREEEPVELDQETLKERANELKMLSSMSIVELQDRHCVVDEKTVNLVFSSSTYPTPIHTAAQK